MIDHEAIRFIGDIPRAQATALGGRPALDCEGRRLSYDALAARAEVAAGHLRRQGVRPGDRVAWLGRNCEHFHVLAFGLAAIGACLTPLNYRLSPTELAFILDDSEAGLVVTTADKADLADRALAAARRPARRIDVATLTADAAPDPSRLSAPHADLLQLYTSGTTGRPKGVRLTNRTYEAFLRLSPQVEGFDYDSADVVLSVMPLFHVAGFNVSMMGLAHGCRVILLDGFDPAAIIELIGRERVGHVFLAPSMIQAILTTPGVEEADFSSLKTIGYGASPIAEDTLNRAQSRFGCGFVQFYGMTESAAAGAFLAPSAHTPDKLLSCGRPWPQTVMRILRPDGSPAEVGEVGEIVIRGPTLMAGYMGRPEATAEALRDGWLHTGDAGYCDADGFFYVHDRIKDMIVSGGENIYPAEVEQAIMGCPGVADVAVIGTPSERWGEEVRAIVVRAPGAVEATPEDVVRWARARIAAFKAPKAVEFVEALPRNASGKVLRRELRAPYWRGHDRAVG